MTLPLERGEPLIGQVGVVAVLADEEVTYGTLVGGGLG